MLRNASVVVALVVACVLGRQPAVGAEPLPPGSQWTPQNSILAVNVVHPKALLDLALSPQVAETVAAQPFYKRVVEQPKFEQFLQVVRYLEVRLGTDWKTALHKLLDGGIHWSAAPGGESLLIVDAEDAKMLAQLHDVFVEFAKAEAAKQGQPKRVTSADYRGVTGWSFGPGEAHALLGNRLLLANRPELLKAAIDLRANPATESLASSSAYQAARQAAGSDATATAYLNVAPLKKIPAIQKTLSADKNPLGTLLFAGTAQALRESNWLAAKLHVEGQTLSLEVTVDGRPAGSSGPSAFASPAQAEGGVLPSLSVPRQIAGLSLYRDIHAFYAAKDKLVPERTSGLIFFENMMGIFFSGRDLTEDILAQIRPEIRVVVAEQKYDPEIGTPRVQVPAFAAILRLRQPKQYADVIEEAWQKAVGLISVTRGQKAQVGLLIDRLTHNGARYSIAYFPRKGDEDKSDVGMQYNFRPALVKLDDYLVLSSTEGLAKDLIDALKKEAAARVKPLAGVHSLLDVDAVQLASILRANRQSLIRNNMTEKGNSREEAETTIDLLTEAVKHLGQVHLTLGGRQPGEQATLQVQLNP